MKKSFNDCIVISKDDLELKNVLPGNGNKNIRIRSQYLSYPSIVALPDEYLIDNTNYGDNNTNTNSNTFSNIFLNFEPLSLPNDILDRISKISFAMPKKDSRIYLNAVALYTTEDKYSGVAATDAQILACCDEYTENDPYILPRKFINFALKKMKCNFRLWKDENNRFLAVFENNIYYIGTFVQGKYPKIGMVIDKPRDLKLEINIQTIKKLYSISYYKNNSIEIDCIKRQYSITHGNSKIALYCENSSSGTLDTQIIFNSKYLMKIANKFKLDTIRLSVKDSNNSALLEDDNVRIVIMPMRKG